MKKELTKYLVEWEIEEKWDPNRVQERIKATKEDKITKAWGIYLGTRKGYSVVEPSGEKEMLESMRKWASMGVRILSATPFLTLEEFEKTLA